jgi:hypothetical protein
MSKKPQISPLRYAPVEMTILLQRCSRVFPGNTNLVFRQNCHLDRSCHGPVAYPKVMKNASVQQPLFMEPFPFPLSSRAYPDFLLHRPDQRPLVWFSLKRTTCSRPKPQLSTGNPGEPRDLQFRGPFLKTLKSILKQNCHLDRSVAKWRDLRFYLSSKSEGEVTS